MDFEWEIALGDEKITRAELFALAQQKSPLVKFRGQWIEAGAAEIQAAMEFLKKTRAGRSDDARSDPHGAGRGRAGRSAAGSGRRERHRLGGRPAGETGGPRAVRRACRSRPVRRASCGPTRCAASPGWRSSSVWGWAPASPTTWGSARPSRRWPCSSTGARRRECGRCCWSAPPRWSATGRRRPPGSRRSCPCWSTTAPPASAGAAFQQEVERTRMVLSSYALLHRDAGDPEAGGLGRRRPRRGAEHQEPRDQAGASGPRAPRRIPHRPDRHAGGEQRRRPVGVMEFLNPGFLGSRAAFHREFFVPIQVYSDRNAAERLRR